MPHGIVPFIAVWTLGTLHILRMYWRYCVRAWLTSKVKVRFEEDRKGYLRFVVVAGIVTLMIRLGRLR